MANRTTAEASRPCSCSGTQPAATGSPREEPLGTLASQTREGKLEELIPIAVVVAAGCVPCARRMVERALRQGSSTRQIQKTLGIVAHMQRQECLLQAVGPEAVGRMDGPLAMARKTLAEHVA